MRTTLVALMLMIFPLVVDASPWSPTHACVIILHNHTHNSLGDYKVRLVVKGETPVDHVQDTWNFVSKLFGIHLPFSNASTLTAYVTHFPCCKHIHFTLLYGKESVVEREAVADTGHCLVQKTWSITRKDTIARTAFEKRFSLPDVIDVVDDTSNAR